MGPGAYVSTGTIERLIDMALFDRLSPVWQATWRIVAFVVLGATLGLPGLIPVANWLKREGLAASPAVQLYFEAVNLASMLAAAWFMSCRVDHQRFLSLGLGARRLGVLMLRGVVLGAVMMLVAVAGVWTLGFAHLTPATLSGRALLLLGAGLLLNSITQEVMTRGYILQTIERRAGRLAALLVSSLIFAVLHGPVGWLAVTSLFLAGLLLGLAYLVTRSLWWPIGIHFGWNYLQGPVLGLAVSGHVFDSGTPLVRLDGPVIVTGGAFGVEAGLAATVVTVVAIAGILLRMRAAVASGFLTGTSREKRDAVGH